MTIGRALVAPLNYSHRQRGQVEAFQAVLGPENVLEFDWYAQVKHGHNAAAALRATALAWRPDWIWLQVQDSQEFAAHHIRQLRAELPSCLITHWMGDCRAKVSDHLAALCAATHGTLVSNMGQNGMYLRAGAPRVHYVQIGLDPEDMPDAPDWDPPFRVPDVVFCGGYYAGVDQFRGGTMLRLAAIRRLMGAGIDVGVVGPGWPGDIPVVGSCHVKHQVHVYRRAKVALSINHFNDIARYYSDRQLIAMASGTPVVAKYVPGLEDEFDDGIHCLFWHELDDVVHRVQHLLGSERLRNDIGAAGAKHVLTHHTWQARIRALVPVMESWRKVDCR